MSWVDKSPGHRADVVEEFGGVERCTGRRLPAGAPLDVFRDTIGCVSARPRKHQGRHARWGAIDPQAPGRLRHAPVCGVFRPPGCAIRGFSVRDGAIVSLSGIEPPVDSDGDCDTDSDGICVHLCDLWAVMG